MPNVTMPCSNCGEPAWSTDGRSVAAPVQVTQRQIETYGAHGAEVEVLTPFAAVYCSLSCAADGLAAVVGNQPVSAVYPSSA